MTRISLTEPVRAALLTLQAGEAQRARASARLASGLKVNSPVEDPQAYFTAGALNARATSLNAIMDGFGQARGAIAASLNANAGARRLLGEMDALVAEARRAPPTAPNTQTRLVSFGASRSRGEATATGGPDHLFVSTNTGSVRVDRNDHANLGDMLDAITAGPAGVRAYIDPGEGDRIVLESMTGEAIRLRGAPGGYNFFWGGGPGLREGIYWGGAPSSRRIETNVLVPDPNVVPPQGSLNNPTPLVSDTGSVDIPSGVSYQQMMDLVNADADFGWSVSVQAGRLVWESTRPTSKLEYRDWSNSFGRDDRFGIQGGSVSDSVFDVSNDYHDRFVALNDQLDQLVGDARYQGVNLALGETVSVELNERGTRLDVRQRAIDSQGLGLSAVVERDWFGDITSIETKIARARKMLHGEAGRIGRYHAVLELRETFNGGIVRVLKSGRDDLTLADPNADGARLLAAQTRQQLSNASLRIATQAN